MKSSPNNLQVLYEDNHLIAVYKRSSDIVQGDKTGDTPLNEIIKSYLKKKYNKPGDVYLGTIHRIDRPVSGVVVFAKTSKALSRMNKQFQEKVIQKTYWTVVEGFPQKASDTLTHFLTKNEKNNKSHASINERKGSKKASLSYTTLKKFDRYTLLEVTPHTGRHHQIRVQLATMGCTIKGDVKYGARRPNKNKSISLHAKSITFTHPTLKEPKTIEAPTPENDPLWIK